MDKAARDRLDRNADGAVDDLSVHCDLARLEQMSERAYWFAAYQGDRRISILLTADGPIAAHVQDDELDLVEGASDPPRTRVPLLAARGIEADSWLNEDRFRWFRDGYERAALSDRAIPALAQVSPETLYFAVAALLDGAGLEVPEG